MKVLHVIPAVAAGYGGPSHAIVGMGRALAVNGTTVLIATTDADGVQRLPVTLGAEVVWQGVPTIFFPRQWSEAFKFSAPLARWLDRHIGEFDVVHIHAVFSHACLAAAGACRRKHVPYIVRPLGTLDPWSLGQKSIRKRLLWHAGVKRALDGAAAIHYTTASERRLAEGPLGLRRGVVIPLGVDDELLDGALDSADVCRRNKLFGRDPYVLVLGRLHPKKGLELFLDVFLELTRRHPFDCWRLVVAGDGKPEYVTALKQFVRERGGQSSVIFAGWIGGDDKRAALRGASLLALPSRQENFGIVVAEALACGTPVLVSTAVNLSDEIADANAGWVVELDHAALRSTLSVILSATEERVQRGIAGRALARSRFTWAGVAAELTDLYTAVSRGR